MRALRLEELAGKRPRKKGNDAAERLLLWQMRQYGLPAPKTQHRFALSIKRQWRWDFAWPEFKLALEVQGGIWTRGAHAHPQDILRNMDKHNDAALLGWRWFQFTPEHVQDGIAALFMQRFFLVYRGGDSCELSTRPIPSLSLGSAPRSTDAPAGVLARRRSKRWKDVPKARR